MFEFDLSATAADGTNQQTRTFGGMRGNCKQVGLEYLDELEVVANASKIGEQALELLNAEECPTGDLDIIIAPDQMMLQIHESIGHALEVDRILGDERNYAGWSFVKLDDFGKLKYGSDLMNITFDPTMESEFASYAFDDGGLKATKEYLIKDIEQVLPIPEVKPLLPNNVKRPIITDSNWTLKDVGEALDHIPTRVTGNNTYEEYRQIAWGLKAIVKDIGYPESLAVDLMEAHSPSGKVSGWHIPQVMRSGGEKTGAGTFIYYAQKHGWKPNKK